MVLLLVGLVTPGLSAPARATLTAPVSTIDNAHVAPVTLTGDTRYNPQPWIHPGRYSCRDCTLEEVVAENVRTHKFSAAVGDSILHSYRENTMACYTGKLVDGEVQISSFHHLDGTIGTAWVYPDLTDSSWDGLRDKDVYICPVPGTGFALTRPDVCSNWNFVPTPEGSGGGYTPPVAQVVPPDTRSGGPEIYWPPSPFDWFGPPGAFTGPPSDFGWPGFPGGGYSGGYIPPGGSFPPPYDEGHHHGSHHGHHHYHKPPPIQPPTVPVPEPTTLVLLLSGVIGLFVFKKSVS